MIRKNNQVNEMIDTEVLAPAGNLDHFKAALNAGADSVYVGLKNLSARPDPWSISNAEVSKAKQLAVEMGKKIYVAINAEFKKEQEKHFPATWERLMNIGVDALIVGDLGLMHKLRELGNTIPIHASTLLGIYNAEGVRFLQKQYGVTRLVLNTSLFLDEIIELHRLCPDMELELIAHGGVCFNDNRRCRQPHYLFEGEFCVGCKQLYEKFPGDKTNLREKAVSKVSSQVRLPEIPVMGSRLLWSPEIDLTNIVGLFMRVGISSFKIEGRTRTSEYIASSTAKIRTAVDKAMGDFSFSNPELNPFFYLGHHSHLIIKEYNDT